MNILIDPLLFLQFIRELTGGIFNSFFLFCSIFGEDFPILILITIVYWCLDKKLGEFLLISQAGAYLVNGFLKILACVYRPWILDSRVHPVKEAIPTATGYSFPSGHTTNATTFFVGTVLRGKLSKGLSIVLIICLLLVGFSRNYLGVHSVLDVIFAIIFTLIVLFIFSKLFDKLDNNPNLDIIISVVGIIISILVVIFAMVKSYPLDYDAAGKLIVDPVILTIDTFKYAGFAVGIFFSWPIERRFIKFTTDGTLETKVLRFICGFIGLQFIINVILPLIGETHLGGFLQYFILMVFAIIIYPIIFKFFESRN